MLMIKLSYGSFHCLLQCVLPNLPIKAIQIIPNISLDEGYAVLCHLKTGHLEEPMDFGVGKALRDAEA